MDVLIGFVSSQEVTNLALTLIHFVWQGAVIASGLWLALILTPRNSFKLRYRSAVFALILSVATPIATYSYLSSAPDISHSNIAQLSQFKEEVVNSLGDRSSEIANTKKTMQESAIKPGKDKEKQADYLGYVLLVWLLGCIFMTFKFVLDLNRTFRLTRDGVAKVSCRVENIVNNLSSKYKLKRRITILKSKKVNVPVVIGWLKPVVLLPIAITIGLETKHLELIIAHELAHIKRMDFAVNLFQSIVQICLFYHPVVYWINKVVRDEREYICDQLALEVLGNDESAKINLAKALLGTEELREGNLSLVAVAASGGMLKHRISHILDSQYKPATSIKSLFIGTMVFLFSFAALSTTFELKNENIVSAAKIEKPETVIAAAARRVVRQAELPGSASQKVETGKVKPASEIALTFEENSSGDLNNGDNVGKPKSREKESIINQRIDLVAEHSANHEKGSDTKNLINSTKLVRNDVVERTIKSVKEFEIVRSNEKLESKQSVNETVLVGNSSKINNSLYRELSNKALTDQYLLPAAAVSNESRLLKTAALDLQSISSFKEPKAIFTPYPKYPRRAWDKMINQTVRVNFKITADGLVNNIHIMEEADRDFAREIRRKLGSWKYIPALKQGERVAYSTSLEFVFKAPQKEPIIPITTGSRIRRR